MKIKYLKMLNLYKWNKIENYTLIKKKIKLNSIKWIISYAKTRSKKKSFFKNNWNLGFVKKIGYNF